MFQFVQMHEAFADYHKELCISINPIGNNKVCDYVEEDLLPKKLSSAWSL